MNEDVKAAYLLGYSDGYRDSLSLFADVIKGWNARYDRIWNGSGEEGKFEGLNELVQKMEEKHNGG